MVLPKRIKPSNVPIVNVFPGIACRRLTNIQPPVLINGETTKIQD